MEYELLFFTPASNEDRVDTIKKELTDILAEFGGKPSGDFHDIGKRKLAYPIKRDTHAFYSFLRFVLEDENRNNIPEIVKRISLNDKITRHLIVRADEIGKSISASQAAEVEKTAELEKKMGVKSSPAVKPAEKKPKVTMSELDEKLSEILEETPS